MLSCRMHGGSCESESIVHSKRKRRCNQRPASLDALATHEPEVNMHILLHYTRSYTYLLPHVAASLAQLYTAFPKLPKPWA